MGGTNAVRAEEGTTTFMSLEGQVLFDHTLLVGKTDSMCGKCCQNILSTGAPRCPSCQTLLVFCAVDALPVEDDDVNLTSSMAYMLNAMPNKIFIGLYTGVPLSDTLKLRIAHRVVF